MLPMPLFEFTFTPDKKFSHSFSLPDDDSDEEAEVITVPFKHTGTWTFENDKIYLKYDSFSRYTIHEISFSLTTLYQLANLGEESFPRDEGAPISCLIEMRMPEEEMTAGGMAGREPFQVKFQVSRKFS